MKPGNAPKTLDDLLRLVDEATFEIEDVLHCADEEGGEDLHFTRLVPVATTLRTELRKLRDDLAGGRAEPGSRKDLLFMPLFMQWRDHLPFASLIEDINRACREGL